MKTQDPRLTAYALGELPAEERADVEATLAASAEARQEVEEVREMATLLEEALAREAVAAEPSSPTLANVQARMAGLQEPVAPPAVLELPPARFRGWRWGVLAAAAVLVLACLAAFWIEPRANRDSTLRVARTEPAPPPVDSAPFAPSSPLSGDPAVAEASPNPGRVQPLAEPASPSPGTLGSLGEVGEPATLMRRYGLVPSPGPDQVLAERRPDPLKTVSSPGVSNPSPAPAEAGQAPVADSPRSGMSAELRSRYGLGPAGDASDPTMRGRNGLVAPMPSRAATAQQETVPVDNLAASGRANAAAPMSRSARTLTSQRYTVSPELMRRYGLAPSPAPSSELDAVPEAQTPRSLARPLRLPDAWSREPGWRSEERRGAAAARENPGYLDVGEEPFRSALTDPLSTLGLDVDTGSYANVRRFLNSGMLPPAGAVRVEEMINYFAYDYPAPRGDDVFGIQVDVATCPWASQHRLVRIAIQAREVSGARPSGNLVFLIDVSGSMQPVERLPLLKEALRALVKRLSPADRVAIVTYASRAGVRLESTSCERKDRILEAIDSLEAGGSTNGEGGIQQAYEVAAAGFIQGGINRVILCTDGDFNVGVSNQEDLVRMIREKARSGVFLTTLGVGTDNFKDALMRRLADEGNGAYHYADSYEEAQRILLEQMDSTLVTVARDAKAQVEFNPARVGAWRLIGYAKRVMAAQDFNDDTKDAGEVGAGQRVTILYEVVPAGVSAPGVVDPLKYQPRVEEPVPAVSKASPELLTVKIRYQRPEGSLSRLQEVAVIDQGRSMDEAGADFRFAAAVAAFGRSLRGSNLADGEGLRRAIELGQAGLGNDPGGWRAEFLTLVRKAQALAGSSGRRGADVRDGARGFE